MPRSAEQPSPTPPPPQSETTETSEQPTPSLATDTLPHHQASQASDTSFTDPNGHAVDFDDEWNTLDQSQSFEEDEEDQEEGYLPIDAGYAAIPDDALDEETDETNSAPLPIFSHPLPEAHIEADDLEIIRNVMASLPIPESAIPDWAKVIPEEAWLPRKPEVPESDVSR
ncbi:hypothetical protein HK097_003991 [Rhizophlyctis rosea]|uniref:Male-enhanced antigen 1 n=1 Tax=Rhizophlyctis rosea TaxID=64517 RepID=A0AAD5S456_9FUNG|nr:hypothetical protein HK097_003991 [Rhizophlyctis rosea]